MAPKEKGQRGEGAGRAEEGRRPRLRRDALRGRRARLWHPSDLPERVMYSDAEIEELGVRLTDEVKATVIRPGDTLVVAVKRRITEEEYHRMLEVVRSHIPGVKVLVIPEAGDIRVFRPDGQGMLCRCTMSPEAGSDSQRLQSALASSSLIFRMYGRAWLTCTRTSPGIRRSPRYWPTRSPTGSGGSSACTTMSTSRRPCRRRTAGSSTPSAGMTSGRWAVWLR